jgi:hypothetical protein
LRVGLRPLLVGEHASQGSADGAFGQLVAELDRLRGLIGGEALLAEGRYLLLGRLALRLANRESLGRFVSSNEWRKKPTREPT